MYEAWTVEWDMPVLLDDRFRRTADSAWGTAPGGQVWLLDGGSATDYFVSGGKGTHRHTSVSSLHTTYIETGSTDHVVEAEAKLNVVPTGGSISMRVAGRLSNPSNNYVASLSISTAGVPQLTLRRRVAGADAQIGSAVSLTSTHAPGDAWVVTLSCSASTLRAKARKSSDPDPGWLITETDTSLTAGTQVGVLSRLEAGNSNTLPQDILWDNVSASVEERWVDVTSYVDSALGPFEIAGGDTPEASADTGGFAVPLRNADQRFTPGNITSPCYPNIAPGSQIRVRETIADQLFQRGYGYVQYPEIAAWTESNEDAPRDQTITIPVVDRAAWIAQGRTFISTLAEHIIHNAGPSLVAYWPMGETLGPDVHPALGAPWTLSQTRRISGYGNAPSADPASITYGNVGIAPSDDLNSISFDPTIAADPFTEYNNSLILAGKRPTSVSLNADQVLTIVGWLKPADLMGTTVSAKAIRLTNSTDPDIAAQIKLLGDLIFADAANDIWVGTVDGPPVPVDQAIPVAFRISYDPEIVEFWVRNEVYTGSMIFFEPAIPAVFDQMEVGESYPGAVNHIQVYLGDPDDWTHEHFLAQYEMGIYGLERQTTGDRIRTILQYAGVDPSELSRIDIGASLMQVARMAGRNPMELVAETVTTEQGEFYTDGAGLPVFADRIRLYNI